MPPDQAATVQPDDIEPEETRGRAPAADWRSDPNFTWPERVPWSVLGEDFTAAWGRADPAHPEPEHLEIVGPTGSGKTYALCTMLQQRMVRRQSAAVLVCTKPADKTVLRLGWPIIDRPEALNDHPNAIFWPRTRRMGTDRRAYHEVKISDLLHKLWTPESNRIVAFDEIGYVESLGGHLKAIVQQYWREGRSQGITVVAMKQRPQGTQRDMHSETYWKAAFPPGDRGDLERWAELFGARRDWMPVFDSLDPERREFVLRHSRSREAYITWMDLELRPVKPPKRTPSWLGGRRARQPA
jgi:hypothetical protein